MDRETLLRTRKNTFYSRFAALLKRAVPTIFDLPASPQEALEVGYRLGLQTGYGEGLVDGVSLGVEFKSNVSTKDSSKVICC